MQQKIDWLAEFCKQAKPKHRDTVEITVNGSKYTFKPGKLLDQIKPYFVDKSGTDNPQDEMSHEMKCTLFSIPWFHAWLESLCVRRKAAAEELPFEDQVQLLILNFQDAPPGKNDVALVERVDGSGDHYKLNTTQVLDKLASHFFHKNSRHTISETLKEEFFALNWAHDWYERCVKRREVARMRHVVTKDMKLEAILSMFPDRKPKWAEKVNIVYNTCGEVYHFYPGTFLDDLVENFYDGDSAADRPSVVLDDAQKIAIRSLPWFNDWCFNIVRRRQIRPLKRALESDDWETDCESLSAEGGEGGEGAEGGAKRAKVV